MKKILVWENLKDNGKRRQTNGIIEKIVKKERDNRILELRDVGLPDEIDKENTKKGKVLKDMKKTLNRNGVQACD